jgi:ABC-type transport system involved in multi-copper enzyme maturation permease subunit
MPVYERGYRHFEGERSVRLLRFAPITGNGFRLAVRSKLFLFLVIIPSQISFVVGAVIVYVFFQQAPALLQQSGARSWQAFMMLSEAQSQIGPRLYWVLLTVQTNFWIPVVGAMLAGRLIAADAQSNALEVYFSRPITRFDYSLGKFLTAFGFLLYVTLVPPVGVWAVACLLAPDISYFKATLSMGAGIALNALLVSSVSAVLLLGLSSASKKPRFASALWVGALIFSHVASQILLEAIRLPACYLVSVFHNFQRIGYSLVSDDLAAHVARRGVDLPPIEASIAVLGALVVLSLFLFVRRLRAVEIVR